ncbi:hypothetical protein AX16_000960 [Volvariella volvacea WC 439]|nr:hypothetical protein AX16_000960 [Volvariella volvacea WC 439]
MFATASGAMALMILGVVLPVHSANTPEAAHRTLPNKVATAWFAGWHAHEGFSVADIPWSKYTSLTYAFAETTPDVRVLSLEGSNPEVLPEFVAAAHRHGVQALVSIGGWTGSRFWSSNVGSAQNRALFVKTLTDFAKKYNLDGLDFDWEYPGRQGIGCNVLNGNDAHNFLLFLQELRRHPLGAKLQLTAATATSTFNGPDGLPLADVSKFAKVLDYIAIMNYDLWGPWSPTVGPNAPLNDTCASPDRQVSSAVSAVKAWHNAGIPLNQLVLGVAGYGHSFRVRRGDAFVGGSTTELAAYPPFDAVDRPTGDTWDDNPGIDVCGVEQLAGGNFNYWGLIAEGFLDEQGKPKRGIAHRYDTCSQTPYVYNAKTEIMVSFDNAQSFAAKGHFIKSTGLRGFAMWEAGGDYKNTLLNSIRKTGGY